MCSRHATVRGLIHELPQNGDVVVVDTEASPEHLSRSTTEAVDVMLVVAEPFFKSLETARRYATLGKELGIPRVAVLANKVKDDVDGEAISEFCRGHDLEIFGMVAYDDELGVAERKGAAPVDHDAGMDSVKAIEDVANRLLQGD